MAGSRNDGVVEKADVVIVGAGPAGLATAVSFIKLDCYSKIVLLERMPRDYKPDWIKSSSLRLIPRGLQWFKEFGLEEGIKSIASEYDRKAINVVGFKKDESKLMNLPPPKGGPCWFLKRPDMYKYLQTQIFKLAKEHSCELELRDESHVKSVEKTEGGFCVSVEPKDGDAYMLSAPLVIGSSGGKTPVYQAFKEHCRGFKIIHVPYMNTGRRRKCLHVMIPPEVLPCSKFGILKGMDGGSLVCFPQHADKKRLAVCWFPCGIDFKDGATLLEYLEKNFPPIDFRTGLDDGFLDAFATHEGLITPQVYYPNRIVVTSGNGGACLVGDAAHIGTPCLANGINSALLDVLSLYKAFKAGIQEGKTPAEMLKDFENEHLEDSKAVVQLLPIGHPYQYMDHPNDMKKRWFNFNQGLRRKYSKKFPGIIKAPILQQMYDFEISYGELLRGYKATSRNMALIAATGLATTVAGLIGIVRLGGKLFAKRS